MRCRNCHTVMMETDPECPICHSSVERATAAAPGPFNDNKPGLGIMLPIFGGAIGGAIYGAMKVAEAGSRGSTSTWGTVSLANPSANGATSPVKSSAGAGPIKWFFAIVLMLVGGLFLLVASTSFLDTWKIARREAKVLTASDLLKAADTKTSPASWITYTFAESKPTDLVVTRSRIGRRGEVQSPCLLVRVEDKWLLATVAPGFEGNELVGRLVPLDATASQKLTEQIHKVEPKSALLPFEFNALDGSASDQRQQFITVGVLAFFGLLGLFLGMWLVRKKPVPTTPSNPAPAKIGSSFLPAVKR